MKIFLMEPSVKFISSINGSFSKKKIKGHFFIRSSLRSNNYENIWKIQGYDFFSGHY